MATMHADRIRAPADDTMMRAAAMFALLLLAAPVAQAQTSEAVVWARATTCNSIKSYIAQYPNGLYVAQAREQLVARNCPDPEAEARRRAEEAQRRAENSEREARELRERLAREESARRAAEQRASDEAKKRQEAEKRASTPPTTTPASSTDQELTRLASIRGDWIRSWLNSDTGPSYFRTGFFIIGASSKTGGWMTATGYPCGGAIVRGSTWSKPTATSSLTFELVYGRLPANVTLTTHSFYHSRTTYLGPTWNDAWRATSEAAYARSGQSCGAVQDRRFSSSGTTAPPPAPTATTTAQELTRLANIRGDWTRGWENAETAPSFFRNGYFMVGSQTKGGSWSTGVPTCGGAIVRGNTWSKPSQNGTMRFELVYGRKTPNSTSVTADFYPARTSYLGTSWNDAWRATSEAAYRASGQSCGAIQDRRSIAPLAPSTTPPATLSVREQVQRDIAGSWRRISGTGCVEWQSVSFPGGALSWRFAEASSTSWSQTGISNWTISYESGRLVWTQTADTKRRSLGLEGGNLVWRVDGAVNCTFTRGTPPSTIR